jgi:Flp pilus assembly protein TadG
MRASLIPWRRIMCGKILILKQFLQLKNDNKGVAMTMFLVLSFVIIPLMGISIDLSRVWHDSYRLEMATRYAAYTGATELVKTMNKGKLNIGSAKHKTAENFNKNFPRASQSVTIPPNADYVIVDSHVTIQQYFMPIFGGEKTVTVKKQQEIRLN